MKYYAESQRPPYFSRKPERTGSILGNENPARKAGSKPALGNEGIRANVKRSDRATPKASDGKR